jgi:hypothetical protein
MIRQELIYFLMLIFPTFYFLNIYLESSLYLHHQLKYLMCIKLLHEIYHIEFSP